MGLLQYEADKPFARGTKKEAFHAKYMGESVVVKRPRDVPWSHGGPAADHKPDRWLTESKELLRDEALLMALHGGQFNPRLLGSCMAAPSNATSRRSPSSKMPLDGSMLFHPVNVVERLTPWRLVVDSPHFPWSNRVTVAIKLTYMLDSWRQSRSGAVVHCDFYTFQFALRSDLSPVLIDLDSLQPVPYGRKPAMCKVKEASRDCMAGCWRGRHYSPTEFGEIKQPYETRCHSNRTTDQGASSAVVEGGKAAAVPGRCVGYDSPFNIYTMCRIAMSQLLLAPKLKKGLQMPDDRYKADVNKLLSWCGADRPKDRPSSKQVRTALRELLTSRKAKPSPITIDQLVYDSRHKKAKDDGLTHAGVTTSQLKASAPTKPDDGALAVMPKMAPPPPISKPPPIPPPPPLRVTVWQAPHYLFG